MNTLTLISAKPQAKSTTSTVTMSLQAPAPRDLDVVQKIHAPRAEPVYPSAARVFRTQIVPYSYSALND